MSNARHLAGNPGPDLDRLLRDDDESREIHSLVGDAPGKNDELIGRGRFLAADCRLRGVAVLTNLLDGERRVGKRQRLAVGERRQKLAALRQRLWMRVDALKGCAPAAPRAR